MNAESSRLRSTGITSSGIRAIWPGALLIAYLAATGVLLFAAPAGMGAAALHWALVAAVAGATLLRGVPRWLRAWTPLLVLFFLYAELPALIGAAGHAQPLDNVVIGWERAVFGGQPARSWAAAMPSPTLSETLHLAYLSYYPIIYVVPAALWLAGRHEEFSEAALALLLTFIACFVCYIAFPVAGPRYLWVSPAPDGLFRRISTWLLESGSSRGTAFPSSHVAVAAAQSVLAVRYFGSRGAVVAVFATGLALGAVYGGFHYAIDVVAGLVLGLGTTALALAASRRSREGDGSHVSRAAAAR